MTRIRFKRKLSKVLIGTIEPYQFRVGILHDKPHYYPKDGKKSLAGGPARKQSRKPSKKSVGDVSEDLRRKFRVNYLTAPFRNRKNRDILRVIKDYFAFLRKGRGVRRLQNAVQAVVRNPILRRDYGSNSRMAIREKGFNRKYIDTGQFFRSITANIFQVRRRIKRVSR